MRTSDLGLKAGEDPSYPHRTDVDFDRLVRLEQLAAVRKGVLQALPINVLLGLAGWAVSIHAGNGQVGLLWLLASSVVNAGRAVFCLSPCAGLSRSGPEAATDRSVERHLRFGAIAALASGLVWACLPLLCAGYTSPQTLFYLTVTCGITAGAVTYGTSYARVPVCFVTPPLLSVAGCLFAQGGFDRVCLGLTVILYLAALVRGTFAAERSFCDASRSKNEARAAAASRELARAEASALATEMEWRATHDDLTTLLNRAGFAAAVEAQLSKGVVRPCLMLIDLDGFKSVNDIYGHETGDRVLREVAWRLRAALPATCLAGRLGGDEFAVFLDAARVAEPPAKIADRLVGMMAHPFEGFDVGRLGLSVGVEDGGERDLTRMLSCADEALYAAKNAGRNRYHLFDESLNQRLAMRRDVKRDLAEALEGGQTEVWFQPIFGQGGRVLNGFEALLRWRHPNHGWISPAELVVLAGMRSLADPLLRFILERVCQALHAFRQAGRTDLRIGMNVSPREMAQLPVDEIVLGALRRHGLRASMLEIEITEETAADIEAVRDKLVALSRAGIRIALDDFGAGYSSLASIRQLYAERIKIDRSLVAGIAQDDGKHRLVEAVLSLGRSLGLDIVAEGVETADDLAALRASGCQSVQGYHLGRPMPLDEALRLLPNRTADVA